MVDFPTRKNWFIVLRYFLVASRKRVELILDENCEGTGSAGQRIVAERFGISTFQASVCSLNNKIFLISMKIQQSWEKERKQGKSILLVMLC